ncbi:MAG: ATP-binding protein, partial [Thermomicrobiales bacterium]
LARDTAVERLDLTRLDDAAVQALVAARYALADADASRLVAYLQARAEGNALFVGELLRSLEEAGTLRHEEVGWALGALDGSAMPPLLRQVIETRLARLDEESQRLLAVAAVIGHEVPLAVWATVAETDEETVLAVVEQGLETRLLVEVGSEEGVRFAHALIREALYEGIAGIRRRRLHRQVGATLADGRNPDPDTVAYHFQWAGDDRALSWLLQAGERAQAAYAWTTAAARFEAALARMEGDDTDAAERGWLLLRLSRLLRYAEVAKARAFVEEAVALGQFVNDGALAAFARYHRGVLALYSGDMAYALQEVEAGADALAALSDAERSHFATHAAAVGTASRVPDGRGTVVTVRANMGRYREARELGERLVAEAAGGDEEVLQRFRDGYHGLSITYAALGMPDEASAMHAIAHSIYLRAGHHFLASWVSRQEVELVALPYRTEDIAGRQRLAERAEVEGGQATDALPAAFPPRFFRLSLLVLEGQWEAAERLALAGSTEERGVNIYRTMALRYLATLARLRGSAERAWWAVREGLSVGSATEPGTVANFDIAVALQRVAAALALDAADLPSAKEWLSAHDRWLDWSEAVLGLSERQALWSQYYRQAGESDQAREHAERALAHATEPRQPLALLATHRLLGELDTDAGRFDDAARHLDASLTLAEACQAPYERALTLLAMAALRVATGEGDTARTLLDEVRAICTPLGAKPTLARADALAIRLNTP